MPYESLDELPEPIKKYLPLKARVIWFDAYNRAYYGMLLPEKDCYRYAYGAVKRSYIKNPDTGKWVERKGYLRRHGFKVFRSK